MTPATNAVRHPTRHSAHPKSTTITTHIPAVMRTPLVSGIDVTTRHGREETVVAVDDHRPNAPGDDRSRSAPSTAATATTTATNAHVNHGTAR